MSCYEGGELVLAMESRNQCEYGFRSLSVQVSRGLIGEQKLRTANERTGQSHPLLLTAGKFPRPMMRALLQSDLTQPA